MLNVVDTFNEYLNQNDWRVKENSNASFSFGTLCKHVIGKASALYWEDIYNKVDKRIIEGHRGAKLHIHDMGSYSSYCLGASLQDLLLDGVKGVSNISVSTPARRFRSACAHLANAVQILQNEVAGAIAFSSVNVYFAPFIYFDALKRRGIRDQGRKIEIDYDDRDYEDIYNSIESMIFQLNSNTRLNSEPAFSNITLDFKVLTPMKKKSVVHGGKTLDNYSYGEFQKEADIFVEMFAKVMIKGDGLGRPFAYPIPTFNISKDVDWDKHVSVWELAAKNGAPYFGNFINSPLDEEDVYSMCCRLRLDKKELQKKAGGLFGAAERTGSVGVASINLPQLGFLYKGDKEKFYEGLFELMEVAFIQLEEKRRVIQMEFDRGLYTALKQYLKRLNTLFSTIGIVGCHEMCLNFMGKGIETKEGRDFTVEVVNKMRDKLSEFQTRTDTMFNLEYTPAESTCHRFALKDKKNFPGIITAGTEERPYYTNSTHLPVGLDWSHAEVFAHQNGLLSLATGGSVWHSYIKEPTTGNNVKNFVRTVFTNYDIPYMSISPVYSVCPDCGFLPGHFDLCPECGGAAEAYQRVTGYCRPVNNYCDGKAQEYAERKQRSLDSLV